MSGTISLSMSQQLDEFGKPLSGGLLYFIEAGTTSTPQSCYQDSALTIPLPNPIVLDAAGRVPQFYLADGTIKIRLTDSDGVQQLVADNVLVVGPSSGSGGGGTVDPTTVFQTGDTIFVEFDGARSGWVRQNGRTIGSVTSGATERANADTQALFVWLWSNFSDSLCPVSSGRGASAADDFADNKTITLLDKRGKTPFGLDTMGNSAKNAFTGTTFSVGSASVAGSPGGSNTKTLTASQIPTITSIGNNTISVRTTATDVIRQGSAGFVQSPSQVGGATVGFTTTPFSGVVTSTDLNSISVSSSNTGGAAHDIMPSFVVGSYYQKL